MSSHSPKAPASLRDAQRELTRQRIRDAARVAFVARGVGSTAMEEIAAGASVARATIYLHYPSKEQLLFDMIVEDWLALEAQFRWIVDAPRTDVAMVRRWIRRQVSVKHAMRDSMHIYAVMFQNPDFMDRHSDHRDRLIAILAERFDAFVIPADGGVAARRRRMAAHLVISQLEQFTTWCSRSRAAAADEAGIGVMTDIFWAFTRNPDPPAANG